MVRSAYDRSPPSNPAAWHPWRTLIPMRDPEGYWLFGRCWRRRTLDGQWQYKSRPEDPEQFEDRAI